MKWINRLLIAGFSLIVSSATGQIPTDLTVNNPSSEGGRISIRNTAKTGAITNDWSIWNMTNEYGNGLSFWRYYADGTNAGPSVWFADNGNVGIGTTTPGELLTLGGANTAANLKVSQWVFLAGC